MGGEKGQKHNEVRLLRVGGGGGSQGEKKGERSEEIKKKGKK